ncbi:MAG TPA: hypothetical protein VFA57_03850 [Pseudolabrys sp.]|nr:hypothetical protein [Pseudolabrys sp.]
MALAERAQALAKVHTMVRQGETAGDENPNGGELVKQGADVANTTGLQDKSAVPDATANLLPAVTWTFD